MVLNDDTPIHDTLKRLKSSGKYIDYDGDECEVVQSATDVVIVDATHIVRVPHANHNYSWSRKSRDIPLVRDETLFGEDGVKFKEVVKGMVNIITNICATRPSCTHVVMMFEKPRYVPYPTHWMWREEGRYSVFHRDDVPTFDGVIGMNEIGNGSYFDMVEDCAESDKMIRALIERVVEELSVALGEEALKNHLGDRAIWFDADMGSYCRECTPLVWLNGEIYKANGDLRNETEFVGDVTSRMYQYANVFSREWYAGDKISVEMIHGDNEGVMVACCMSHPLQYVLFHHLPGGGGMFSSEEFVADVVRHYAGKAGLDNFLSVSALCGTSRTCSLPRMSFLEVSNSVAKAGRFCVMDYTTRVAYFDYGSCKDTIMKEFRQEQEVVSNWVANILTEYVLDGFPVTWFETDVASGATSKMRRIINHDAAYWWLSRSVLPHIDEDNLESATSVRELIGKFATEKVHDSYVDIIAYAYEESERHRTVRTEVVLNPTISALESGSIKHYMDLVDFVRRVLYRYPSKGREAFMIGLYSVKNSLAWSKKQVLTSILRSQWTLMYWLRCSDPKFHEENFLFGDGLGESWGWSKSGWDLSMDYDINGYPSVDLSNTIRIDPWREYGHRIEYVHVAKGIFSDDRAETFSLAIHDDAERSKWKGVMNILARSGTTEFMSQCGDIAFYTYARYAAFLDNVSASGDYETTIANIVVTLRTMMESEAMKTLYREKCYVTMAYALISTIWIELHRGGVIVVDTRMDPNFENRTAANWKAKYIKRMQRISYYPMGEVIPDVVMVMEGVYDDLGEDCGNVAVVKDGADEHWYRVIVYENTQSGTCIKPKEDRYLKPGAYYWDEGCWYDRIELIRANGVQVESYMQWLAKMPSILPIAEEPYIPDWLLYFLYRHDALRPLANTVDIGWAHVECLVQCMKQTLLWKPHAILSADRAVSPYPIDFDPEWEYGDCVTGVFSLVNDDKYDELKHSAVSCNHPMLAKDKVNVVGNGCNIPMLNGVKFVVLSNNGEVIRIEFDTTDGMWTRKLAIEFWQQYAPLFGVNRRQAHGEASMRDRRDYKVHDEAMSRIAYSKIKSFVATNYTGEGMNRYMKLYEELVTK